MEMERNAILATNAVALSENTVKIGDGTVDTAFKTINVLRENVLNVVSLALHPPQPLMSQRGLIRLYDQLQYTVSTLCNDLNGAVEQGRVLLEDVQIEYVLGGIARRNCAFHLLKEAVLLRYQDNKRQPWNGSPQSPNPRSLPLP